MNTPKPSSHFVRDIQRFHSDVFGLLSSYPLLELVLRSARSLARNQFKKFAQRKGAVCEAVEGHSIYEIPVDLFFEAEQKRWQVDGTSRAVGVVVRSMLVSLVSQFDAFVGRLIRTMYKTRPEMLDGMNRQLTLAALRQLGTIDAACGHLIEEEVESILRKSHTDQFESLESKLKIPLREDLDAWKEFIEITQRRHLFVHNDGIVSAQYRSVCMSHGISSEQLPSVGSQLSISQDYFHDACAVVLEIGIKLAQVMWRKLIPECIDEANDQLQKTTFDLIQQGQYRTAIAVLSFACKTLLKKASAADIITANINLAQAHKWSGDSAECRRILEKLDLTAAEDKFNLAQAILLDKFSAAVQIMKRIGCKGPIKKEWYKSWPMFRDFRKSVEFSTCYSEIFGERFVPESACVEISLNEDTGEFRMSDLDGQS